jgi:hypothetical protein
VLGGPGARRFGVRWVARRHKHCQRTLNRACICVVATTLSQDSTCISPVDLQECLGVVARHPVGGTMSSTPQSVPLTRRIQGGLAVAVGVLVAIAVPVTLIAVTSPSNPTLRTSAGPSTPTPRPAAGTSQANVGSTPQTGHSGTASGRRRGKRRPRPSRSRRQHRVKPDGASQSRSTGNPSAARAVAGQGSARLAPPVAAQQ